MHKNITQKHIDLQGMQTDSRLYIHTNWSVYNDESPESA